MHNKPSSQGFPCLIQRLLLVLIALGMSVAALRAESRVTFQTDDGWKLDGTLFMPEVKSAAPAPVILLLTEPEWIDRTTFSGYLAGKLAKQGVASLAIDFRGMGSKIGRAHV